jgi:hypothetical protein
MKITQPSIEDYVDCVKVLFNPIRKTTQLPLRIIKDITRMHMMYLLEHASPNMIKEYEHLDRETSGFFSIQVFYKGKLDEAMGMDKYKRQEKAMKGHPGAEDHVCFEVRLTCMTPFLQNRWIL